MQDANDDYRKPDDFIFKDVDERQVIDLMFASFEGRNDQYSNLNVFNNLLYGETYLQNWRHYVGCYCLQNFLVKDLPLDIEGKPGEIDILLLPFDNKKVYYEKCSVFEVKVAKPRFENMKKGANSDGYSQIMGLVNAGFPYVGVIHVVLAKPIPDASKHNIKFMKRPANAEEKSGTILPKIQEYEMMKWDWLPFYAEKNQMKRLLSYDIPKYVGLKVFSLQFNPDASYSLGYSTDLKDFETGYVNPHKKTKTIEIVKRHHNNFHSLYKKIEFHFPK